MKKFILFFLLISESLLAQTSNELFSSANNLYKEGKYEEAISLYNQILEKGEVSSEVYYNIGNSYYKLNKVAPTIYNYEKALKLDPANQDAHNNLVFAKRLTLDRIEALPKTLLQKINENYLQKLSYNTWGMLAVLASLIACLLFLGYYFSSIPSQKKLYFTTSIISFLLLFIFLAIGYNQYSKAQNTVEAIIFSEEAIVNTEPTQNANEAFILHEGTKVNVLDQVDDWKKIKLADGKIGWILSEKLKEL
ncbi:tetratricopeptide repeat protein [Tenacibaculum sp. IB213877]|uniref:tetratricopeptide repeat protein n=1 Tax=Tenacibaculum sp. IB213877 TaxID=3097351 RepID=UPI002A59F912|nr:tetratricopeptide repeat protein [Tenacibaculum sp. IB213877]MDY0781196.1 tetratricopeptide repeat protein [Tenacibaculum sp. IB213877]